MTQARSRSTRPRDSTAGEIQLMKIFKSILVTKLCEERTAMFCFCFPSPGMFLMKQNLTFLSARSVKPHHLRILDNGCSIFKTRFAERWYSMVKLWWIKKNKFWVYLKNGGRSSSGFQSSTYQTAPSQFASTSSQKAKDQRRESGSCNSTADSSHRSITNVLVQIKRVRNRPENAGWWR